MLRNLAVARGLFWAAAVLALVMALMPHPPHFAHEPGDKIQHITGFATLAILGSIAYPRLKPWKLLIALCAFGALIEFAQAIPVLHRDSELLDWVADTGAVTIMLGIVGWFRAKSRGEVRD